MARRGARGSAEAVLKPPASAAGAGRAEPGLGEGVRGLFWGGPARREACRAARAAPAAAGL